MTATVIILTLVYFITKFNTIADKKNPIMNEISIQNYYGTE